MAPRRDPKQVSRAMTLRCWIKKEKKGIAGPASSSWRHSRPGRSAWLKGCAGRVVGMASRVLWGGVGAKKEGARSPGGRRAVTHRLADVGPLAPINHKPNQTKKRERP